MDVHIYRYSIVAPERKGMHVTVLVPQCEPLEVPLISGARDQVEDPHKQRQREWFAQMIMNRIMRFDRSYRAYVRMLKRTVQTVCVFINPKTFYKRQKPGLTDDNDPWIIACRLVSFMYHDAYVGEWCRDTGNMTLSDVAPHTPIIACVDTLLGSCALLKVPGRLRRTAGEPRWG